MTVSFGFGNGKDEKVSPPLDGFYGYKHTNESMLVKDDRPIGFLVFGVGNYRGY